jgi:hypothetical protein
MYVHHYESKYDLIHISVHSKEIKKIISNLCVEKEKNTREQN